MKNAFGDKKTSECWQKSDSIVLFLSKALFPLLVLMACMDCVLGQNKHEFHYFSLVKVLLSLSSPSRGSV
jgi:hypothetical protein